MGEKSPVCCEIIIMMFFALLFEGVGNTKVIARWTCERRQKTREKDVQME